MRRIEKETKREIIEKSVIWEASDGTIFSDELNCKNYEASYRCSIITCFLKVPHVKTNACELYIKYAAEDHEAYMMKPRNIEDIHAINAVLHYVDNLKGELLTQDDIDKTIIVGFTYDGIYDNSWYDIYRKEDYLKEITDNLNGFEAKIGA